MRDIKEYKIGEIVTVNGYVHSITLDREYINNNLDHYKDDLNIIAGPMLLNGKRGFYKSLYKYSTEEKQVMVLGWSTRRTGQIDILESQSDYWEPPEVVGNYLDHDLIVSVLYVMPIRKNSNRYCVPFVVMANQIISNE